MAKKKSSKRNSLGAEIIEGLTQLHETMQRGERIEKYFTVRRVKLDLRPREYDAQSVRLTRAGIGVSQALFAQLLGAGVDLVQSWEQGLRKPNAMACRLLDEINLDPARWRNRLKEAIQKSEVVRA